MSRELDLSTKVEEAGREYNTNAAERAVHEAIDGLKNRNQAEDLSILVKKLESINKLGLPSVTVEDKEVEEAPKAKGN